MAARREDRLREVLRDVLRARLLVLEQAVREAQATGELRSSLPPDALAWFFYLLPVGLLAGRAVDLPTPGADATGLVFDALYSGLLSSGDQPRA